MSLCFCYCVGPDCRLTGDECVRQFFPLNAISRVSIQDSNIFAAHNGSELELPVILVKDSFVQPVVLRHPQWKYGQGHHLSVHMQHGASKTLAKKKKQMTMSGQLMSHIETTELKIIMPAELLSYMETLLSSCYTRLPFVSP